MGMKMRQLSSAHARAAQRSATQTDSEIYLYCLDLDAGTLESASALLAADERARAARFRFDLHRQRYLRGRAALRRVLGQHLGIAPQRVALRTLQFGKPVVDPRYGLAFNLAHSEQRAILAVGRGRELGVDIELLRAVTHREALAEQHFSSAERLAIRHAPLEQRDRLFFNCWTRKEAYLKMLGAGIARDLTAINVGVDNDSSADVEALLHTIAMPDGAVATIASNRPWAKLHFSEQR